MTRFVPEEPPKTIRMKVTLREADLLEKLRDCPYGKIVVHKVNGKLIRLESRRMILIEPIKLKE